MEVRAVRKRAVIVVSTDKGLCGALNSNLLRVAAKFDPATTVFITAGTQGVAVHRAHQAAVGGGIHLSKTRRCSPKPGHSEVCPGHVLEGRSGSGRGLFTQFHHHADPEARCVQFLPVGEIKGLKIPGAESEADKPLNATEFLFEPSPEAVLGYLLPHY